MRRANADCVSRGRRRTAMICDAQFGGGFRIAR